MRSQTFKEFLLELSPAMMAAADVARAQDIYAKGGRSPARQLIAAKKEYTQRPDPNEAPEIKTARMKVMRTKTMLVRAEQELAKAAERVAGKTATNGTQKPAGTYGGSVV